MQFFTEKCQLSNGAYHLEELLHRNLFQAHSDVSTKRQLLINNEIGSEVVDTQKFIQWLDELEEDFKASAKEGMVSEFDLELSNVDLTIPKGCDQKYLKKRYREIERL